MAEDARVRYDPNRGRTIEHASNKIMLRPRKRVKESAPQSVVGWMNAVTNGRESGMRVVTAHDVEPHRASDADRSIRHVRSEDRRQRLERSGDGVKQRHAAAAFGRDRGAKAPDKTDSGLEVAIQRRQWGVRGMILRGSPREEFLGRAPVDLSTKDRAL